MTCKLGIVTWKYPRRDNMKKPIVVVSCHAEGEVGDVIVEGVDPPPGNTIWDQREFIATDQTLRNFLLNEPRGGVFRHFNLLVPAKKSGSSNGFHHYGTLRHTAHVRVQHDLCCYRSVRPWDSSDDRADHEIGT